MTQTTNIVEVLTELGYKLKPISGGWSSHALFRDGDNPNALKINNNGTFKDFVSGEFGSWEKLIALTLGETNIDKVKEYIKTKNLNIPIIKEKAVPVIKLNKVLDSSNLGFLVPDHTYLLGRGINIETAQEFQGGIINKKHRLSNRYTWPIFNSKKELVGMTGRTLINKSPKYYHWGEKNTWVWPAFFNLSDIKERKEVIIVESPMDILSLFTVGVRNCLCLFGVTMNLAILNFLIKINPNKIIIATNNDEINGGNVGNESAKSLQNKLLRYFDKRKIIIKLPELKDLNEVLVNQGKEKLLDWVKL